MTKANKYVIGKIFDKHLRGSIKRDLIKAQLLSEVKVRSNKDDRNKNVD